MVEVPAFEDRAQVAIDLMQTDPAKAEALFKPALAEAKGLQARVCSFMVEMKAARVDKSIAIADMMHQLHVAAPNVTRRRASTRCGAPSLPRRPGRPAPRRAASPSTGATPRSDAPRPTIQVTKPTSPRGGAVSIRAYW